MWHKGAPVKFSNIIIAAAIVSLPIIAIAGKAVAVPEAASPSDVPEPSDLALFALGVAGLIIGRQTIRNRRR